MSATLSTSNVQTLFQPIGFPYNAAGNAAGYGMGENVAPTIRAARSGENAVLCIQGTVANGKRMGQNGSGVCVDGSCYTLDTIDPHAVCYAQNQRYEVRAENGDGAICGALPANPSGKQLQFVAYAIPSNAIGAPNSGTNSSMAVEELCPTMKSDGKAHAVVCMADGNAKAAVDEDMCGSLKVGGGSAVRCVPSNGEDIVGALCARDSKGVGSQCVGEGKVIAMACERIEPPEYIVRRLTPTECERLQGFPDGWTDVEHKGKPASDAARYKALGNSMAVPVMRWIGERIEEVELWSLLT
ncbi:DNA cytosine methyltransferase [Adlercreutzia sp. R25]|nr:DNA cytosine methyltransferase [Adlercreutzia sp. R25]MEC4272926.1 DNA cytosine methyltransferase [Adlercreutzia sp. R25]